jgi:hypothetical protein
MNGGDSCIGAPPHSNVAELVHTITPVKEPKTSTGIAGILEAASVLRKSTYDARSDCAVGGQVEQSCVSLGFLGGPTRMEDRAPLTDFELVISYSKCEFPLERCREIVLVVARHKKYSIEALNKFLLDGPPKLLLNFWQDFWRAKIVPVVRVKEKNEGKQWKHLSLCGAHFLDAEDLENRIKRIKLDLSFYRSVWQAHNKTLNGAVCKKDWWMDYRGLPRCKIREGRTGGCEPGTGKEKEQSECLGNSATD